MTTRTALSLLTALRLGWVGGGLWKGSAMPTTSLEVEVVEKVEYLKPGSFVPEEYTEARNGRTLEQLARDAKPNVFCFTTYKAFKSEPAIVDGHELRLTGMAFDKSPRVYIGGEIFNLRQLAKAEGRDSILYRNIKNNGYKFAIKCRTGNWQHFAPAKGERQIILEKRNA